MQAGQLTIAPSNVIDDAHDVFIHRGLLACRSAENTFSLQSPLLQPSPIPGISSVFGCLCSNSPAGHGDTLISP